MGKTAGTNVVAELYPPSCSHSHTHTLTLTRAAFDSLPHTRFPHEPRRRRLITACEKLSDPLTNNFMKHDLNNADAIKRCGTCMELEQVNFLLVSL